MSFIAGIVSLTSAPLDGRCESLLLAALPPVPTPPYVFSKPGAVLIQVDLGLSAEHGYHFDESSVAVLAGDPLFRRATDDDCIRYRGAAALQRATGVERKALASQASGTWAAAIFNGNTGELELMSDRLAVRPLYWWSDGKVAIFASSLSMIERMSLVPKEIDMLGLLERVSLGYSLADRTPYVGVRRLMPGEVVLLAAQRQERMRYWTWASLPEYDDVDALPALVLESLRAAVQRRRAGREFASTFLSGGLDSRVINQLLHDAGTQIRSFNFSPQGSQDAYLGRRFSEVIGTDHHEVPLEHATDIRWSAILAAADAKVRAEVAEPKRAAQPAWSGDGGSVCGGWVYITPSIIEAMRRGHVAAAVREHLRNHALTIAPMALRRRAADWIAGRLEASMIAEIERYPGSMDPARRFFLFLVENDQRRHLDDHFEGILEHRQEMLTPFFDGDFLQLALAVPADAGIGHGFYERWFRLLPPSARSVAWQTYPGHIPCTLPKPADLSYQWSNRRVKRPSPGMRKWIGLLSNESFPTPVFRRSALIARALADVSMVRDGTGSFRIVSTFSRYWRIAAPATTPW